MHVCTPSIYIHPNTASMTLCHYDGVLRAYRLSRFMPSFFFFLASARSGESKAFTANVGINVPTSQLSFTGNVMSCRYLMQVEADVPMARDLEVVLPLEVTAPGSLVRYSINTEAVSVSVRALVPPPV